MLPKIATAQFQAGERFVSGGLSFNFSDNKYEDANLTNHYANYNHSTSVSSGHFTKNNKAVGWSLSQSLSLEKNVYDPNLLDSPRKFRYLGFGVGRFVEYYKPVFEKFALYLRPSVGLTYGLGNNYNYVMLNNGTSALSQSRTNTITLGLNLNAGIAWRLSPKWALYGGFAFVDPISLSAGWTNAENPGSGNPQSAPIETEGSFFKYDLSPALSSGNINLGFRYFYTRNKSSI